MIFDTLVRYSDAGVDLVPDLATAWQSSPDATVFTFHLRRDVRFTNGRLVTSADFKYAIERVLDPATRSKGIEYYRAIAGAADFTAHRAKSVAGIETPDPFTIAFHLNAPDPIFLQKLAMPFASAVPREAVDRWGEDFGRHVVGSGPFILKQWIGGQRIVLTKNPAYFIKGLPHLDAVVESIGVSEDLQWFRFEGGEIDVSNIPPGRLSLCDEDRAPARPDPAHRHRHHPLPRHELPDGAVYRRARAPRLQLRRQQAQADRGHERPRHRRQRRPAAGTPRLRSESQGLSLRSGARAPVARSRPASPTASRRPSGCPPIRP